MCRPRTRGGGPPADPTMYAPWASSPHPRGWSAPAHPDRRQDRVVPAPAGVGPITVNGTNLQAKSSPHPRGLVRSQGPGGGTWASSPHPWGWSVGPGPGRLRRAVVPALPGMVRSRSSKNPSIAGRPAHAWVVRTAGRSGSRPWCRPRTRGVVQGRVVPAPARGWSNLGRRTRAACSVVLAPAGVVGGREHPACTRGCRPRTRGGPQDPVERVRAAWSSPRTRGWSGRRLHHGRGVAVLPAPAGWSDRRVSHWLVSRVVPAHAGVVRTRERALVLLGGRPRTRGGGPDSASAGTVETPSSPHPRGWSDRAGCRLAAVAVVPAPAGVVRSAVADIASIGSRPRTREDGSSSAGGPNLSTPSCRARRLSELAVGYGRRTGPAAGGPPGS
jgi:hypothetical protein